MHWPLLLIILNLEITYIPVLSKHIHREKRQTDVSYGSPAYKYCECGRPNSPPRSKFRIIGGKEVSKNEFPWMAAIIHYNNTRLLCGGSIINDRYVITAAHCLFSRSGKKGLKVVVGEYDLCKLDSHGVIFSIEEFIPHPKYDKNTQYADIMLLKLAMRITFNKYIRPICLTKIGTEIASRLAGISVSVLGWGYGDVAGDACVLRTTNVTLYKPNDCPTPITSLLCAGYTNESRGACSGDSGGPLQVLNKDGIFELIGIVSNGPDCGNTEYPDFYTNVAMMIPWIMKVTTRDSMYCWR